MTFAEFQAMRKRATAAEMKRAGVTHNERTQYGWLYPDGLLIESTKGWGYAFLGMYLLEEGRECFTDDLEQLERILYERYSGGHAASTTNAGRKTMYNIAIQHGEERSLAEVFRATTQLFRAFGNPGFVAFGGERVHQAAHSLGPFEQSGGIYPRRMRLLGNSWYDRPYDNGPQHPEPGNAGTIHIDQNGGDPMPHKNDTAFKLTLQYVDVAMRELLGSTVTCWENIEFPETRSQRADLLGET